MGIFLWLKKYTHWNFEETIVKLELKELRLGIGGGDCGDDAVRYEVLTLEP